MVTGSGYALGGIAVLAAGLTAFYMTRLMLMTFFGRAALGGRASTRTRRRRS